uniref:Uncharacterized protein n=1 Tax=Arundo donax TaxID=35708 RepID=A0A0A8ZN67_ARUDO
MLKKFSSTNIISFLLISHKYQHPTEYCSCAQGKGNMSYMKHNYQKNYCSANAVQLRDQ